MPIQPYQYGTISQLQRIRADYLGAEICRLIDATSVTWLVNHDGFSGELLRHITVKIQFHRTCLQGLDKLRAINTMLSIHKKERKNEFVYATEMSYEFKQFQSVLRFGIDTAMWHLTPPPGFLELMYDFDKFYDFVSCQLK